MKVFLSDGTKREAKEGASAFDIARIISPRLAKEAIAAKINDELVDLTHPLHDNDRLEILTFDTPEGREVFWHSSAHVLAHAVKELFPSSKLAIGPAIENGFYYDFDVEKPFSPQDIAAIEKRAAEIISRRLDFIRVEIPRSQLREYFERNGEIYKVELLDAIEGEPTVYRQGEWQDLCRGPHIMNTSAIKAFKILSIAGAYWRGSEKNRMLQRIYGISFPKQSQLDEYLRLIEEAQKRDHRKLGRDLGLFSFHQEGAGFPFWLPKGTILFNTIVDYSRKLHLKAGYVEVRTPIILNEELWHRSGHWDKYRENMYFTEIDKALHAVKPMNCPGHLLIYKNSIRSYRDFPLKFFEFGLVHRHEKAGVLHGLFRVRQFTQDDAHIFCTPQQIEQQVTEVIHFTMNMYRTFGFENYKIELSTRPEQFIGSIDMWDRAEEALKNVLDKLNIKYQLNPGEGAFYGPKIDFHIKDVLNRSWQCGTVQLDFSMPERFDLEYTDIDGVRKRPVMIHRALFGSMERFIGILLEHYGGALPPWLAPVQVSVLPISDRFLDYAREVYTKLSVAGIRVELDDRNEKIGYKIREAEVLKTPFMVIIGEKEIKNGLVSVRKHGEGDKGSMNIEKLIELILKNTNPAV